MKFYGLSYQVRIALVNRRRTSLSCTINRIIYYWLIKAFNEAPFINTALVKSEKLKLENGYKIVYSRLIVVYGLCVEIRKVKKK